MRMIQKRLIYYILGVIKRDTYEKEKRPQEEINQSSDENTVDIIEEENEDNDTIDINDELVNDEEQSSNNIVMTAKEENKAAIKNRNKQYRKN